MNISYNDKIQTLELSEKKSFLESFVDILYDDYLKEKKPQFVLLLLNKLFACIGFSERLDSVGDIIKCKIIIADIKKLNSYDFLVSNSDTFMKIGLDINVDFNLDIAKKRKKYGTTILKKIIDCIGYNMVYYHTTTTLNDGTKKQMFKYKFVKI